MTTFVVVAPAYVTAYLICAFGMVSGKAVSHKKKIPKRLLSIAKFLLLTERYSRLWHRVVVPASRPM
jgi:hypothetical protein